VFYLLAKIGWFVATPSNALPLLILAGVALVLLKHRRSGLGIALAATAGILIGGLAPVANALILPLEERFPPFRDDGRPVDGIILLGGSVEPDEAADRGQFAANDSAERIMSTITLARRYPQARIVISGGSGTLFGRRAEAPLIAVYLTGFGLAAERLVVEDRSRTTAENAAFTRSLVEPKPGERWLLVTSAWHMPRAVGVFGKVGFPVTPYPVDFRTGGRGDLLRPFGSVSVGLKRLDLAMKEWVGLVAYRLSGRTSELFPGPSSAAGDMMR
jgi:uncharacterized SAM-binding protein YcdF (DUF218 family)